MNLDSEKLRLYYIRVPDKRFVELQENLYGYFRHKMKDDKFAEEYLLEKKQKIFETENTPGAFLKLICMLNVGDRRIFAHGLDVSLRMYISNLYDSICEDGKYNVFDFYYGRFS